jgi:(E)-4-hydroxy-3-methylbut-2-enyl-diphosphate synthase
VRVSCPDEASTAALPAIVKASKVPIVADIHFHYRRAIEAAEAGAACLRINPGNIGSAERVREVVKAAKDHGCSMRIGVNAGSLKGLLAKTASPARGDGRERARYSHPEDHDFHEFKISEGVRRLPAVAAYQAKPTPVTTCCAIGITEAGAGTGTESSIGWACPVGRDRDTVCVPLSVSEEESAPA